jgi:hypothetical protein
VGAAAALAPAGAMESQASGAADQLICTAT